MTNIPQDDLIVCGGGVVGLAIAWQAARRGWKVRVLEQRTLGSGASWAGAGILPPGATQNVHDPLELLRSHSDAMFDAWCRQLFDESKIDFGYRRCGGLYLARSKGELATLTANQTWWNEHGIEYQRWSFQETVRFFPCLRPAVEAGQIQAAWYLPAEGQIRNPRYLKALETACQTRNVQIHEMEAMHELVTQENSVLVRTANHEYHSNRVCLTAGAWTVRLTPEHVMPLGIYPVRGQMLLFHADQPLFESIINEGHRYLVPRDDGYILAGSCEEEVGFDERTTPEMIASLTDWVRQLVPALNDVPIERTWSGLRPGTIDGLPYLGRVPDLENVFIAAGHFRHGIHLSPITADVLVSLMANEPPRIDLSPFRITRGKTFFRDT